MTARPQQAFEHLMHGMSNWRNERGQEVIHLGMSRDPETGKALGALVFARNQEEILAGLTVCGVDLLVSSGLYRDNLTVDFDVPAEVVFGPHGHVLVHVEPELLLPFQGDRILLDEAHEARLLRDISHDSL